MKIHNLVSGQLQETPNQTKLYLKNTFAFQELKLNKQLVLDSV